jgi:hypothetical protein
MYKSDEKQVSGANLLSSLVMCEFTDEMIE